MCCPCFEFSCRFKSMENKLRASQLYEIAEMKNEHLWPRRNRMRLVSLAEGHIWMLARLMKSLLELSAPPAWMMTCCLNYVNNMLTKLTSTQMHEQIYNTHLKQIKCTVNILYIIIYILHQIWNLLAATFSVQVIWNHSSFVLTQSVLRLWG